MPPFYIGSTSVKKIESGYRGSIKSKKYKSIWNEELKINSSKFKTRIISIHNDRKEALEKELHLQRKLNVVKSPLYINMAYATVNGFFGMSCFGKEHPSFGRKYPKHVGEKVSLANKNRKWSKESKDRMSATKTGTKHSPETILKMKLSQPKIHKLSEEGRARLVASNKARSRKNFPPVSS